MTCIRRRRASWGHGTRTTAQTRFAANATEQRGKTRRLDEFVRSELTPRQPDVDLLDALPGRDLDITSLPVSESSSGRCTENPALTAPIADAATRAGLPMGPPTAASAHASPVPPPRCRRSNIRLSTRPLSDRVTAS
jgi:hypothetical protein